MQETSQEAASAKGASPGPDEKQAGSLAAALAIVEKKIRNLEKRKGKLDGYREDSRRGKTLNEDQQAAVNKYDEVIGTLEFARELTGQFGKLAVDEAKDRKKSMKKEQQERARQELTKVSYVLGVREVLNCLLEEGVLEDLKNGTNGAPQLTEEQLDQLEQFRQLATPNRDDLEKGSFDKQVAASAEHLLNLAEQKTRPVIGTTYKDLSEIINTIRECDYMEARWSNDSAKPTENGSDDEATVEDEEEVVEEEEETATEQDIEQEAEEEETNPAMNGHYSPEKEQHMLGQSPAVQAEPSGEPSPVYQPPQPVAPEQIKPAPVVPEPSFNFLQESQIDMDAPHMDPAVVMVHPPKRVAPVHQGVPPGIPTHLFQQQLASLSPAQQQAVLAQQQNMIIQAQAAAQQQALQLQQNKQPATSSPPTAPSTYTPAFDTPPGQSVKQGATPPGSGPPSAQPAPFTKQGEIQKTPSAVAPNPRAPREPEGTPQYNEDVQSGADMPRPSGSPQLKEPNGYAAASVGSNNGHKQPDSEIGTWKPEGIQDWSEEGEEDGRWGDGRGRGRGRGGQGGRGFGRGNRGYSRGKGDRGGEGGRGGYRGDRGGDSYRGGDRGRGERKYNEERRYDDRRGGYRGGRGGEGGRGGGRGGYAGGRGGEGGRGGGRGGGQNGYRD